MQKPVRRKQRYCSYRERPRRLDQLISAADITGIAGNGVLYDTQLEAGVDSCDVFIAVSLHDESNIIGAITAKKIGAKYTIARVRDPEFSSQINFVRESLGITLLINPELVAASEIAEIIEFPSALGIERFDNGRVKIVEVKIAEDSPLAGKTVKQLREEYPDIIVCVINSGGNICIPNGDTAIQTGDHIHITGLLKDIDRFYVNAKSFKKRLHSALIVGGGRITHYLLPRLTALKMRLKVVEKDPEMADSIAAEFPDVDVVLGDGTEQAFLKEEGLGNYDALIALTGVDEENLLLSIFAAQQGVKKTICKVNRVDLLDVIKHEDIDSVITPSRLIADSIIRFVRARKSAKGSDVDALYRLENNRVEALQFHVLNESKVKDIPLQELKLLNNLIVAFIIRNGKAIFPSGTDAIANNDRVIVVTTHHNLRDIDDILA